jgi:hypothetical protein
LDPELAKDPEESLAKAPVLDESDANESEEVGVEPDELELSLDSMEPDDESQGVTVVVGIVNVAVYVFVTSASALKHNVRARRLRIMVTQESSYAKDF